MANGFNCQVDVELGPVQMLGRRLLNVQDLANGRVLKPRELREGQKQFLAAQQ